jgi:uncharacterized protein (TIGR02217 family)
MSVTILNERLTDEIETGAVAYPSRWSTTRLIAANGVPHHNINWSRPIGRWDLSGGWDVDSARAILNMHMNTRGMGKAFLFRDPADFRAESGEGVIVNESGTLYLGKRYTVGSTTYTRTCKRIVSGSATLLSGTSINYTTGVVTGGNAGEAATFEFLKVVAFDNDELPIELMTVGESAAQDTIRVSSLGLVEIPED